MVDYNNMPDELLCLYTSEFIQHIKALFIPGQTRCIKQVIKLFINLTLFHKPW